MIFGDGESENVQGIGAHARRRNRFDPPDQKREQTELGICVSNRVDEDWIDASSGRNRAISWHKLEHQNT